MQNMSGSLSGTPWAQGTVNMGSLYGASAGASVTHQTATATAQSRSILGLQLPALAILAATVFLLWNYYE